MPLTLEEMRQKANAAPGAAVEEKPVTNPLAFSNPFTTTALPETPRAPTFQQKYGRMGPQGIPVPLDTTTGAPWSARLKASFYDDPEKQKQAIQGSFHGSQVDVVEGNQFIIRNVQDPSTGTIKDMLFDEQQMSGKDFIDMAATVPQIAASIIALRKGNPASKMAAGKMKLLAESALGAGAAAGAGVATDMAAEMAAGRAPTPEILKSRGMGMVADTALGFGMGKAFEKLVLDPMNWAGRPRTHIQEKIPNRLAQLENETGLKWRMTYAERTGNPIVGRGQVIVGKTPSGRSRIQAEIDQSNADELALQNWFLGEGPMPDKGKTGLQAVETLRQYSDAADWAVTMQKQREAGLRAELLDDAVANQQTMARDGIRQLSQTLDEAVTPAARGAVEMHVGDGLLNWSKSAWATVKPKQREFYDAVENPGIPIGPLNKQLDEVQKKLVKATVVRDEGGKLVDEAGDLFNPVLSTTTGREVVPELVPEGFKKLISGISKLDEVTPLSELRALRTQINDAVSQTDIFPGTTTKMLKDFSHSITEAIEKASDTMDPATASALKKANQFYRESHEKFEPVGIREMLKDPAQTKVGGSKFVQQAISDPDQYFRLKKFLTEPLLDPDGNIVVPANIEGYNLLRGSAMAEIERQSMHGGSGKLIDVNKFLSGIESLNKASTTMAEDIMGGKQNRIMKLLYSQRDIEGVDLTKSKIDGDDLKKFLADPNPSIKEFDRLVALEKQRDELFKNNILKGFLKGDPEATAKFDPAEFVDRWLDLSKNDKDVPQVLALLSDNPEKLADVRRLTINKLFNDVSEKWSASTVVKGVDAGGDTGVRLLNDDRLAQLVLQEPQRQNLKTLLGADTFGTLEQFLALKAAKWDTLNAAASAVGGMKSGSLFSSIFTHPIKELPQHIQYYLASRIITSPALKIIFKPGRDIDPEAAFQAWIVSAPMVQDVMKSFGVNTGPLVMDTLARAAGVIPGLGNEVPAEQPPAQETPEQKWQSIKRGGGGAPTP
jgi:hypothetical protein